jgi:hypothetical protein
MENTTASAKPSTESFLVMSKTEKVKPPGPGRKKPQSPSANTITISRPPRISMARAEILMPRCCRKAISGAPTSTHTHQSHGTLTW